MENFKDFWIARKINTENELKECEDMYAYLRRRIKGLMVQKKRIENKMREYNESMSML